MSDTSENRSSPAVHSRGDHMGPETTVAGLRRIFGSRLHCISFSGTALLTGILLLLAAFVQNIKAQAPAPVQSSDQKVDQSFTLRRIGSKRFESRFY